MSPTWDEIERQLIMASNEVNSWPEWKKDQIVAWGRDLKARFPEPPVSSFHMHQKSIDDMRAAFLGEPATPPSCMLVGIKVIHDDSVPPGAVDCYDGHGNFLHRIPPKAP